MRRSPKARLARAFVLSSCRSPLTPAFTAGYVPTDGEASGGEEEEVRLKQVPTVCFSGSSIASHAGVI